MPNNQPTKTSNNNSPKTPAKEGVKENFQRNNVKDSFPKKNYTPMQGSQFGTGKDPKGK